MTQWRFQSGGTLNISDGGDDVFAGLFGGLGGGDTESDVQTKVYNAYTFSDLRANVNILVDGGTIALRDDGVTSSNVSISVTGTGWDEDVTGSDTPDANSLLNLIMTESGGMHGDRIRAAGTLITYEHASIDAPIQGGDEGLLTADGFMPIKNGEFSATEARTETLIKRAQTASNLRIFQIEATINGTLTIRINQVSSSNLTITVSTSGQLEDLTGTESYAADDDFSFFYDRTTGNPDELRFQIDFDTPEDWWGSDSEAFTTREYKPFSVSISGNTTADDNYTAHMGSTTAGNLQTFVSSAGSGTRDVTLRVASTDSTNLTISVTGTGFFEDITGSEAVSDTDNVTASMASTSGAVTVSRVAVELPFSTGVAPENPDARAFMGRIMVY